MQRFAVTYTNGTFPYGNDFLILPVNTNKCKKYMLLLLLLEAMFPTTY